MKNSNQNWYVTIIGLGGIIAVAALLAADPEKAKANIAALFDAMVLSVGAPIMWFGVFAILFCLYMSFSRYGKIKLGTGKPEYSLPNYISMMFCGGLGSSAVYWSLTEWTYYYTGPAYGVEALTPYAGELATAYNMFHWGFIPWGIFTVITVPVAYAYYVRKLDSLRLSSVCEAMMGNFKGKKIVGGIIDVIVVAGIAGCCAVMLGLGLPMLSAIVSSVTGIEESFGMNVCIILAITIVFTISSYVGTEKGMQRISQTNVIMAFAFMIFFLFYGPTDFILRQITDGFGIMIAEFPRMATYTDPIARSMFPDYWTMFFTAYGYAFAMLMFLFITKISRGRSIREMCLSVTFGGAFGCFTFFGINGSFSMSQQLSGKADIIGEMADKGGPAAIVELLRTLPASSVLMIIFVIMAGLFLATSLDSAAFSLSASTTKVLREGETTNPFVRVFWCLICAAIPLAMIYIKAPLSSLQTLIIFVSLPIMAICVFMIIRLAAWLKEDFPAEEKYLEKKTA